MQRDITTLEEAMALLDEYIGAYDELRREYAKLQRRVSNISFSLEHAEAALSFDRTAHELTEAQNDPFAF